jgi:preprotein translocase subunit SecD
MRRLVFMSLLFAGCSGSSSVAPSFPFPAAKIAFHRAEIESREGLVGIAHQRTGEKFFIFPGAEVTADDIAEAYLGIPAENDPDPVRLTIRFTPAGREKMKELTERHFGKPLAVLVDGQLRAAPIIRSPISDSAVISGAFTKEEARRLHEASTQEK